jgi:hypothetical protein
MDSTLQNLCNSLDDLAQAILTASSSDQTFTEQFGWNCPPLTRIDISSLSIDISNKIKKLKPDRIDDDLVERIELIPEKIETFKTTTLPHLFNSNCVNAITTYTALIQWINIAVEPIFSWEVLQDSKALPTQLAKRLRSIQVELENIVPEQLKIESKIKLIQDATEAAESLPTDLESLKNARKKVDDFSSDSAKLFGKIETYHTEIQELSKNILNKKHETDLLVEQCEEAYRITTTKGLAASFEQRANKLANTMWIWVVGLASTLVIGSFIGASRFEILTIALKDSNPNWGIIWIDIALSIVGLAAPIWFAWIATKQINQRFRLAEDYAFKSSVAKAYEGYRKEASRIDEAFEARLFSSALSRLEEAPLRLVENENHGSPWQELLSSPAFLKAMDVVPELKNKFITIAKEGSEKIGDIIKTKVKDENLT